MTNEDTGISISVFEELYAIGLHPIPVAWNNEAKKATAHPLHTMDISGKPSITDVNRWLLLPDFSNAKGMALKLYSPSGMVDFDLKNTEDKTVYETWFRSVNAIAPGILKKVCIENTRSGGYHVYIKFQGINKKVRLAGSTDGKEVIALYTGGLLSYCFPTPGYSLIHNDFNDIQELTDEEFDIICTCANALDKDDTNPGINSDPALIDYPSEYENTCLQFDKCDAKVFGGILNSIDLFWEKIKKGRYGDYDLYKRKGSTADYSAKVYFSSNRCLIFSGSMSKFPTWHDRTDENDKSWILTPSRILYYKNNRDWPATMKEMKMICESSGMEIIPMPEIEKPIWEAKAKENLSIAGQSFKPSEEGLQNSVKVTNPVNTQKELAKAASTSHDTTPETFPYDVFPKNIQHYIGNSQENLRPYLAGSVLVAVSTAIGNSRFLTAKGRKYTGSIYLAIVASTGGGKSPGMKKGFVPLEKYDAGLYDNFKLSFRDYKDTELSWKVNKKTGPPPQPPPFLQLLIKDSTIEMVIKILSQNPCGCTVFADELTGFINRWNKYKDGDEVQKWLEMWSGDPVLLQRMGREENKVQEPFCNIIGGIQPGVLDQLSANGKDHNGFYHRFLIIYPETASNPDWEEIGSNSESENQYTDIINRLLGLRSGDKKELRLTDEADQIFAVFYNKMNGNWARTRDENLKGVLSKYKDYYTLRLALILQIMENPDSFMVSPGTMTNAIRLVEYFLGQMKKAMKKLSPGNPVDKLPEEKQKLYYALPENFSWKTGIEVAKTLSIPEKDLRNFVANRSGKCKEPLFEKDLKGNFSRLFW